ncbi:MAG: hypothetical protein ACI8RN_001732 [Glaciecola sp.]|jgi:hypothetical protein|uniref:hypothetical protein n=1 Tax=Congregibacter sp. TaxID=2744308 RepID=UPI0039E4EC7D
MTALIATSVVRGSRQGESHGGVYLINLETDELLKPIDWNKVDIDWAGRGWDRGLRGIAFHGERIFIAASDEIFAFDQAFNLLASYKNPYLKHCHEIAVHQNHLFISSTGFDSILGLNLDTEAFDWGLHLLSEGPAFAVRRYDPRESNGPLLLNKLHLNNIFCDEGGMYMSGLRTKSLLRFDGKSVGVMTTLPEGVHNARPFLDGVLFNDTRSDALRFESPKTRKAFRVPRFPEHKLTHTDVDDSRIARQGFGRGLCTISDDLIAAGSSPSTVTLYDLREQKPLKVINLSMDIRNAIHGLQRWPFEWPQR